MSELREYLEFIRPWTDQSYKVVVTNWNSPTGKAKLQRGAVELDEIEKMISHYAGKGEDVWFGTQTYAISQDAVAIAPNSKWFKKVSRKQASIEAIHNFWCDLDVKDGAYPTLQDAVNAIYAFCQKINLPVPSLMVCSGYGLHCYWRIEEDMTLHQWQPVAQSLRNAMQKEGVLADHGCTIDSARILRPPGTWNFKDPAKPLVTYIIPGSTKQVYKLDWITAPLMPFMGPHIATVAGKQVGPVSKITANLSAGLDESMPVSLHEIASECAVIEHEFATNGSSASQPLWSLMALASAFDINPWDTFQELSDGHASYDAVQARHKLDEKIIAKAGHVGWPSCKAFAVESTLCQTCPHFIAGGSPLHLKAKPVVDPAIIPGGKPPDLPHAYWQKADGTIWTTKKDERGRVEDTQVACWPIGEGALDDETGELVFRCQLGAKETSIRVTSQRSRNHDLRNSLCSQGFLSQEYDHRKIGEFVMAWATHLRGSKTPTMKSAKLGWDVAGSFTHADTRWIAGVATPAVYRDPTGIQKYMPRGDIAPWRKLMDFTTSCGNPGIEVLAAVGFAAPLMDMVAAGSTMLSPYSKMTSAGKTTSLRLTTAIWGNPTKAMFALTDSPKSVDKALGEVSNLPIIWDEIRTKDTLEDVVKQAFQLSQNRSRNTLRSDRTANDGDTFKTLMVAASNYSLSEMITNATSDTDAGAQRIFEVELYSYSKDPLDTRIMQMDNAINNNYGHAGVIYAAFLSRNRARLEKEVLAFNNQLTVHVTASGGERFWLPLITSILMGAKYANECGLANFNVKPMLDYLLDQLKIMRTYRDKETRPVHKQETIEELFAELLSSGEVIFTDVISHHGQKSTVQFSNNQSIDDVKRMKFKIAQVATTQDLIRIALKPFSVWLRTRSQSPRQVREVLINNYGAVESRGYIGSSLPGFSNATVSHQRYIELVLSKVDTHLP
jgi:hypothetical protein